MLDSEIPSTNTPGEKAAFTGVKETLLITLYAKACESRLPDSLLHDTFAAEAVRRIDYDFAGLGVRRDDMIGLAMRAHILDGWTRDFIGRHPGATVLHLGCGLDTRVFRLDPPAQVRWFDVDYPEVIALRRRLYPQRAGYTLIASSVTDPDWLAQVPADAPAMVIAEGLLMYLGADEAPRLLQALTTRLPGGEVAFDALNRLGVRLALRNRMIKATGAAMHWALDHPRELSDRIPGLQLVSEYMPYGPAESAQIGRFSLPSRIAIRILSTIPVLRKMGRLLRYRF